jgi:hypothetical protein
VSVCDETVPETAGVTVWLTDVESLLAAGGAVEAMVAVVPVVAVVFAVVPVVVAAVPDEDLPATAIQPVSSTMPATLTVPAILRARRAGCGRGRRRAGGLDAVMAGPFAWK